MPTVRVNDITMYYEIHGEGEPIVLIAGLNSDHTLYQKVGIIPLLAERYKVVAFDNRGMGQTDKPDIPYSIARQLEASRSYDCMDRLNEIHVPTLILHGKNDKSAPYHLAEEMLTFDGGHLFFILRQKQFMEAIAEFLDSSELHLDTSAF